MNEAGGLASLEGPEQERFRRRPSRALQLITEHLSIQRRTGADCETGINRTGDLKAIVSEKRRDFVLILTRLDGFPEDYFVTL